MTVQEIETAMKESFRAILDDTEYGYIDRLIFDRYDPEARALTLYASDAVAALYVSQAFSHLLVAELEQLVGAPASIVCKYKAQLTEPHDRFTVLRETT